MVLSLYYRQETELRAVPAAGPRPHSEKVAELRLEPALPAPACPAPVCLGAVSALLCPPPPTPWAPTHFWHSSSTKALGWSSPDMVMTVSRSKAPGRVWSTVWRVMVDVV